MKNGFVCLLFLSLGLLAMINCSAKKKLPRQVEAKLLIAEYPRNKASPIDSNEYSVQIKGQSNVVTINGKLIRSTFDTIDKKNKIIVNGEGNIVDIKQSDIKSEVIIQQKGNKNHINIIQNKK